MIDDSFLLLTTAAEWPWIGIILILVAAFVSVGAIAWITRRQIRSLMRESSKMAFGAVHSKVTASTSDRALTTTGRGQVIWNDDGYTMTMVRRFPHIAHGQFQAEIDQATVALTTALANIGIEPSDVVEGEHSMVSLEVGQVLVEVHVRDGSIGPQISKLALTSGFTEVPNARRAQITLDEAHQLAGQRAVKDAMDNTTTLLNALNLPADGLQLVSADLETVSLPGEEQKIVKVAKARWSLAPLEVAEEA